MSQAPPDAHVNFQALLIANEQRNAYGLRYNDYERYRKHCANRTHRLRSSLKMTHGKGREFKKLPPLKLETIQDGHLQLLLFEAERAWVYSQELSQSSLQAATTSKASAGQDGKSTSLRRHATSRMRRAVNWSTQLLSHCQSLYASSRLSAEDLTQATIYTLVLNGRFLRHRYEFEDALIQLSVARHLLDELAAKAATSREQALAIAFADEISPEIRHCAHEMRREKAYDVDAIVSDIAPKHRNEIVEGCDALLGNLGKRNEGAAQDRKNLNTLMWEDEPVPVRNPELVDVLLKVQEAERRLKEADRPEGKQADQVQEGGRKKGRLGKGTRSKRGVAAYDAILLALSDAEDVARRLVEVHKLSGATAGNVVAGLLSRRIQRDLLLISTLLHQLQPTQHVKVGQQSTAGPSKPRKEQVDARLFPAVVKLLDTIIQSLNQMRTLTIVDESPDLASAVEARLSFTKARRCCYLARSYAPLKQYAEALTLTQHASIHLRESRSVLIADLDQLEENIGSESLEFKKAWFTYNGGSVSSDGKSYKKPLFFDIALNYVQLDMDRLHERAGKAPAVPQTAVPIQAPVPQLPQEKKTSSRAKVEEIERAATPEPSAPARGGLGGLLGGWWGRK
ncbi:Signal recognition particle subunit SRP68 [Grifola frondosa]|uniref:Signal recognition particle subunit SRP68 n=1 Tax=Grifola frondosa TaxID=5627 RepID=A0A1C7MY32_GRIFR|nr:Signal recognition particle subunit SRP68 [Grifola frondosa]